MEILRKILYVICGVYILFCLLLLLNVVTRDFFIRNFDMVNIESVYNTLLLLGIVLLISMLLLKGFHTAELRTSLLRAENQVNDLKARLYEKRKEEMRVQHDSPSGSASSSGFNSSSAFNPPPPAPGTIPPDAASGTDPNNPII